MLVSATSFGPQLHGWSTLVKLVNVGWSRYRQWVL